MKLFKFLEFDDLNDEIKKDVIEFYKRYLAKKSISKKISCVRRSARKSGVIIYSISLSEINGNFEGSAEYTLEMILENGLVSETDQEYVYYRDWYKSIIEGGEDQGAYEFWVSSFLEFVLERYLLMLQELCSDILSKNYISYVFRLNGYVFTESGNVFRLVGKDCEYVANVKATKKKKNVGKVEVV